jgi:hypothetical protein
VAMLDEQGRTSIEMRDSMRALREASESLKGLAEDEAERTIALREGLKLLHTELEESRAAAESLAQSVSGFKSV